LRARRLVGSIALGTLSLVLTGAAWPPERLRTADTCRSTVDTAVQAYMAARRTALLQCHSDTNEGRLAPRDCETEPLTAAALATAERTVLDALHRGCSDATVTSPPPTGIGAEFCGEDEACGFSFTRLDDGTRDDRDDYVDCLLCLADDAVKTQIDSAYVGLATSAPPRSVRECRTRFTQAIIAFDTRRTTLESQCPNCPKTAARLTEAREKIATRLLADCREATATAASQPSPNATSASAPPSPDRTARKP
jgi:hypothetical protein